MNRFSFKDLEGYTFTATKILDFGRKLYMVSWVENNVSHNILYGVETVEQMLSEGKWMIL